MENVVALPGMAIAAKNEVRSLLVVSKVPIEMAKSIALDTNSRSTVGAGADALPRALEHRARIYRRAPESGQKCWPAPTPRW